MQTKRTINQQKVKRTWLIKPTKPTDTIHQLRTINIKSRTKSPIRCKANSKQNEDKQLKAQIVKVLKNSNTTETTKNRHININRKSQAKFKKCRNGLHKQVIGRPIENHGNYSSNDFYWRNNAKTKKLKNSKYS